MARSCGAELVVRVWGDCSFIDPAVVDLAVEQLRSEYLDFVTNALLDDRIYPAGLDVEVYTTTLLRRLLVETDDPRLREFPVEFMLTRTDAVKMSVLDLDRDLSGLHLTVDYPKDLDGAFERALDQVIMAYTNGESVLGGSIDDAVEVLRVVEAVTNSLVTPTK